MGFRRQPSHKARGNPCSVCGQPEDVHRKPRTRPRFKRVHQNGAFLGIDGEGIGRNPHLYVLLAAVDENGKRRHVENMNGLSTVECLDFIIDLPAEKPIYAYAFNYDLTKILKDVDDESLYKLFRPVLRQRRGNQASQGPKPVIWKDYTLNLQGSKFVLTKGERRTVIWDIFKFFQGKFVAALKDWKVGNQELYERMGGMKAQRGEFANEQMDEIREYCFEECLCMAQLARKLVDAHVAAGLELTSFYGAGSSASAMLKKMGIREQIGVPPKEMAVAIAQAFFGGRFENSVIGEINGPVYNYDISSAYPYQTYFLPCLLHAQWSHTTDRKMLEGKRTALVRYSVAASPIIENWAPFPFRDRDGNICYPRASLGGWVWMDEYLAGERAFPKNVRFHEAWLYEENCNCHPFKDIAHYYNERCRIGKEGPGIVLKLGSNSVYGKIAQSIGNGIFNSWAWAGMITSGCRAQILDLIAMHENRADLLMIATDGIFTTQRLNTPIPEDTGTGGTGKPLGGWEEKVISQNVFVARPGIYFPINPTKAQLKDVRGRGVGKGVVFENWELIRDTWAKTGLSAKVEVANVVRFCGAKTSISRSGLPGKRVYHRADGKQKQKVGEEKEMPAYGEWVTRKVEMSYDPLPKRESVDKDGRTLILRSKEGEVTTVYSKAGRSIDDEELRKAMEIMEEQPDGELWEAG